MSLAGARGLVRVSMNLECELQTAMVIERVKEPEFYRRMTGREFPGEYGERVAARRRGAKFEANLHMNNAALLRRALGPQYGLDPDTMVVRNLLDETPGPNDGPRALRLHRTRSILRDLAVGRPVPDLLIQPQLRLPLGPTPREAAYISPDFMVFNPNARIYLPGEEKSFIVRDGVGEPGDLDRTRRQAGAEILALYHECERVGLADRVSDKASFVFATPYGLVPAAPAEERLQAEMHEISKATEVLRQVRLRLLAIRLVDGAPLHLIADELRTSYQDRCTGSCILASLCRDRVVGRANMLGDVASDLLGPEADLHRIDELLQGASPADDHEARLVPHLTRALEVLGYRDYNGQRRTA